MYKDSLIIRNIKQKVNALIFDLRMKKLKNKKAPP